MTRFLYLAALLALFLIPKNPVEEIPAGNASNGISPEKITHCWDSEMLRFCYSYTQERR